MRSILWVAMCGAVLGAAAVGIDLPAPAAAQTVGGDSSCTWCTWTPPSPTEEGFHTGVRSQVNRLNNGGAVSGGPPPCSEEDLFFGERDGVADHVGHMAYEPPDASQDILRGISENTAPGMHFRLSCFVDDGFVPPYPGISIDFFPEINPQNLARLAVAEALTGVPSPRVGMNPVGDQLVNLETWLWVDGAATETIIAPPLSVPGITVAVTVSTGGVYWRMGDGAEFFCPGRGTPYGTAAVPSCSHTYEPSSATAPGDRYEGSATVTWLASYTVNGQGPFRVDDAVVRQTPFSVRVTEAQAVVITDGAG
ncbi:MAG: hypothetical protein ACRD0A_06940 [Acidimicrobiales bacterium]